MNRKLILLCAILMASPFIGIAEVLSEKKHDETMRARMDDIRIQTSFKKMVDEASEVYGNIVKGAHGKVPASVLANARCIAVLPNVITGAALIGGTHGSGLASCKNDKEEWSLPAPISLNQASFGLQFGAKSTDLVLYFGTKQAVEALKGGDFAIGKDVSAVAGKFDTSIEPSEVGILAYSRTDGLFAGVALKGGKLGSDNDELETFYGKDVKYSKLLEGQVVPDSSGYSKKLTKLFP